MITIKEIAEMMNVSPTTVANVIHGHTNKVSKANIEKIQKALKEYNYVPKRGLEALTKGKSQLILVVVYLSKKYEHTLLNDPFYGSVIGTLEHLITQSGYYMMLYVSKDNESIMATAISWSVAGIITVTTPYSCFEKLFCLADYPIVGIDTFDTSGYTSSKDGYHVNLDDREAGRMVGRYLINGGFRNILVLSDVTTGNTMERVYGIEEVMIAHNLPFQKPWFYYMDPQSSGRYTQLKQIFPLAGKDYVLFCTSDQLAFSVLFYLQNHGYQIPDDFSLIGFDDNYFTRYSIPPLTTVHQDMTKKAHMAFDILMKLIEGVQVPQQEIHLPVNIIPRKSVRFPDTES
jgi:LacI family transcriptional regulator